jgi:hypothetical protein
MCNNITLGINVSRQICMDCRLYVINSARCLFDVVCVLSAWCAAQRTTHNAQRTMHDFENRSDVTLTPDLPYFSRVSFDKRGHAISSFVLKNMLWYTKYHPDTAKIMLDQDGLRDLTPEEKLAPCYPFIPRDSSLSSETYTLLQPFAASHPSDECPLSNCRTVLNGASVSEIMNHIYDMSAPPGTVCEMQRSVYFEGLKLLDICDDCLRIVVIQTGS